MDIKCNNQINWLYKVHSDNPPDAKYIVIEIYGNATKIKGFGFTALCDSCFLRKQADLKEYIRRYGAKYTLSSFINVLSKEDIMATDILSL